MERPGKIYERMISIMQEIGAVGKGGINKQQGFKFRAISDVYNAIHPVMAKHGVFTTHIITNRFSEPLKSKSGGMGTHKIYTYFFFFKTIDGSYVTTEIDGEANDFGDKGVNKTLSIADKYAIVTTFKIPFEKMEDPDSETIEGEQKSRKPAAQKSPPATVKMAELTRLWTVASNSGWTKDEVHKIIKKLWNLDSTKDLNRARYDYIVKTIQAKGYPDWATDVDVDRAKKNLDERRAGK